MDKLNKILADVLEIEVSAITDQTSPETVQNWDSFNALIIVSELEAKFNVKFTMEEIVAVKNVGDIRAALKRHKAL